MAESATTPLYVFADKKTAEAVQAPSTVVSTQLKSRVLTRGQPMLTAWNLEACRPSPARSPTFVDISCLDLLGERALPKRLSHPARCGTQRYQSHHRFDAEERSFRVRDGERRVPFEIAKGD